jgi:phage terminase large subunit
MEVSLELPPKLIPVFAGEARYRGSYGGRGSAKTRSFAKMAAVKALQLAQAGKSGIILCAREFMNSLADSSMAEVKAAIASEAWLAGNFDVGERFIRTREGLPGRISFEFAGLRHNLDSIKSKAFIHVLWVDEAETVSRNAWEKSTKTVREDGSEIWVTWNPEKEDSETHQRFRVNPPPGSRFVELNWRDNPWFPSSLEGERQHDLKRDPDLYDWVWEGGFLRRSEARVFNNWEVKDFGTPPDARLYFGADWGYSIDPTVLVRCWLDGRTLYVDHEAYKVGCEIDHRPALFKTVPGSTEWPCRGDSASPDVISYMQRNGFPKMTGAVKGKDSVKDGVAFLQSQDIIVHPRCKHTIQELTRYSYKVDPQTDEVLPDLADKDNHVIDSLRYALEGVRRNLRASKTTTVVGAY